MGSSAQAINNQNLETTTTIRTEIITGSHLFKIIGYSLNKGIGRGMNIDSHVFTVGGYNWKIKYYPDGANHDSKDFISISLQLESEATDVKARTTLIILQKNGAPSNFIFESPFHTFSKSTSSIFRGAYRFAKRTEFEASELLKDDAFTMKCTVTVKRTIIDITNPYGVIVPPSNLNQNLANLLESGKGADVTFAVKRERFMAHRCVLAARSDVFNAELFGCMKEKSTNIITVKDIEAPIFKSMLYFIYSDSLPDFEGNNNGEKHDLMLMVLHLLIAADRYQLERLRLMCEDLLCKNFSLNNVGTMLLLAEQHNCSQLKAECLKFMSSPEVFKAVAKTEGFLNSIRMCPFILKDI